MIQTLKRWYHFIEANFWVLYFGHPGKDLTVIGVTGTDGKTTTTSIIYHVLKKEGIKASMISSVHAVIGGIPYDTGFHVTTPGSYYVQKYLREAVDHGDTHMVLEVTSHGIAQHRILGIPFVVGVITNVTHEHLDWHKTFERYVSVKLQLLSRCRVAVVNKDASVLYERAVSMLKKNQKLVTYGTTPHAMVNTKKYPIQTVLPGEYNMLNCLAATGACLALGISPKAILRAISSFTGLTGRMEILTHTPCTVIVDFAHTPNAIEQVLKTVKLMVGRKGKLIHVFGSAGLRDRTKRPLMGEASSRYSDIIVLTEEDYRTENVEHIMNDIAAGISKTIPLYRFPLRSDAISFALAGRVKGDVVILTGKGHERSLCRGAIEYPWSDQEEVKKILSGKSS
jgi:UDP-N-acetylmuramoyl-L-alanyl-D-glutamate--2,6-diaminopimelate ligase